MTGKILLLGSGFALAAALLIGATEAQADKIVKIDCADPKADIQKKVDEVKAPTTIFLQGTCVGDVGITKDDVTLSGNEAGVACDKADPSASAAGTIDGTITIDGVRANIEFLEITGSGEGILVTNRADAEILCSHIHDNDSSGVAVNHDSNAVLRDNLVADNRNFHCVAGQ